MTMELRHYGSKELALSGLRVRSQDDEHRKYFKPHGLWVSVLGEYDWKSWCESEDFGCLDIEHTVTLRPDANILHLSTVEALISFHHQFKIEPYPSGGGWHNYYIDWPRVAEQWDGIIIAPYQWSQRLDGVCHNWYYGWDCASGCIWHPRAIAAIDIVTERERLRQVR